MRAALALTLFAQLAFAQPVSAVSPARVLQLERRVAQLEHASVDAGVVLAGDQLVRTFSAGDGCNTCTDLGHGAATCTLMACNVAELERDAGASSPAPSSPPNDNTTGSPILDNMLGLVTPASSADAGVDAPTRSPCDEPGAPADVPGTSYCIRAAGVPAPIPGRLVSFAENKRRAQREADEATTLQSAKANGVLLPKAAVAALISAGAAAVVTSIALGIALAAVRKGPGP